MTNESKTNRLIQGTKNIKRDALLPGELERLAKHVSIDQLDWEYLRETLGDKLVTSIKIKMEKAKFETNIELSQQGPSKHKLHL